jgi:predicted RNA-binding Zn-ribbon protein involved in translation (DUF1610 family)
MKQEYSRDINKEFVMLIAIQKKLNATPCPSCGKKNVLQASLSCSRDEKKCATSCQCSDCGIHLLVQIPEELSAEELHSTKELKIECGLSQCEIVQAS